MFLIIILGVLAIVVIADKLNQEEEPQTDKPKLEDYGEVIATVEQVRWNNTRDGQWQCWLKLDIDGIKADMSKYIQKKDRGIIQQYKAMETGNIIRVDYQKRGKYFNINSVRKLQS